VNAILVWGIGFSKAARVIWQRRTAGKTAMFTTEAPRHREFGRNEPPAMLLFLPFSVPLW
jgi:hypothetical protein